MSDLDVNLSAPVVRALDAYAPPVERDGEWEDVLRRTGRAPASGGFPRRLRLLLVALLVLALLAGPTYAIGRAVVAGWLEGEPAPQSVVDNFGSYTPQLRFRPEPGEAVLVAADRGFSLYATRNERGSYCVATSTPDGGICVPPSVAASSLVAGIMPGDPGRADARRVTLVAGRVDLRGAEAIAFTDPDGATVTRPLGSSGFFLAALSSGEATSTPPYPCKNRDWAPTFRALAATGEELARTTIRLADAPAAEGVLCSWANGPHR